MRIHRQPARRLSEPTRSPARSVRASPPLGNHFLNQRLQGDRARPGNQMIMQQTGDAYGSRCPDFHTLPRVSMSGLLIENPAVREAMLRAYRRSGMGALRSSRLEYSGKILRGPNLALHTMLYPGLSAHHSSANPTELGI